MSKLFKAASQKGINEQVDNMIALSQKRGENGNREWALSVMLNGAISNIVKFLIFTLMLFSCGFIFANNPSEALVMMAKGNIFAFSLVFFALSAIAFFAFIITFWRLKIVRYLLADLDT